MSFITKEDLAAFAEGKHPTLWKMLGARAAQQSGATGVRFALWAPFALHVAIAGDFNDWKPDSAPMTPIDVSGVWSAFIEGAKAGQLYKFEVTGPDGDAVLKADPFARASERPPRTASVIIESSHAWSDARWIDRRASTDTLAMPLSIYECHLGSWRHNASGGSLSYREAAPLLSAYLLDLGFTHIEFMPLAEHPFRGSWGYQSSSYFAPTARFGGPDDLRYLIDHLHRCGIGVILDWVPGHFPRDDFALARFDGTSLYEYDDPRRAESPDWGTYVFDLTKPQVRNFLIANAMYWLEEFHVDGLRVDAVASMLYLDYSRKQGEWVPNRLGGRENLEAIEFFRELNTVIHRRVPGVMVMAEESTDWPGVTRPVGEGGLGFGYKWSLGWMHDTLRYFGRDPIHRQHHHEDLTFALLYQWNENFILPLSHDEVVHEKRSLLGRMPGDEDERFAGLRALFAWMWAHPGKPLLFMGGEIAQAREWSHDRELDWHLLVDGPRHKGVQTMIAELNRIAKEQPSLWERDMSPDGFEWIESVDRASNVFAFLRKSQSPPVACVANLSATHLRDYRVGLPTEGEWFCILDSQSKRFGGLARPGGHIMAEPVATATMPYSAPIDLAPLTVFWLIPKPEEALT